MLQERGLDNNITLPYTSPDGKFTIDNEDTDNRKYVVFDSRLCNITIGFYGHGLESVASISIPGRFGHQVTGLCGACKKDCSGPLVTKNGTNVQDRSDKYRLVSESFEVDESLDKGLQFLRPST